MIPLKDKPNVEAVSVTYPYASIKDDTGADDGTPVDRLVYSDMHQFFERLMALTGLTPNGLPDNAANGFQLMTAFLGYSNRFNCASLSSLAIGTGNQTFTVPANMSYLPGNHLRASNGANYMQGPVVSYSGTTLIINVVNTAGSGTIALWIISPASPIAASETNPGVAEIATQAEVNASTDNTMIVTAAKLFAALNTMGVNGSATKLFTRVVAIEDWNMDTTATFSVAHGITDFTKIRSVNVIIQNDTSSQFYTPDFGGAVDLYLSGAGIDATNISFERRAGGVFDNAAFADNTSFTRGWITIIFSA